MRHKGRAPQSSLIMFRAAIRSDTRQCTDSFSAGDEIFVGRDGLDVRFGRAPVMRQARPSQLSVPTDVKPLRSCGLHP